MTALTTTAGIHVSVERGAPHAVGDIRDNPSGLEDVCIGLCDEDGRQVFWLCNLANGVAADIAATLSHLEQGEFKEVRLDALRYRWLRARRSAEMGDCWISLYMEHGPADIPKTIPVFGPSADAHIDAAMKKRPTSPGAMS